MSEQVSEAYYEVCGTNVQINADLKRFGKLSCSSERRGQKYVRAREVTLALMEDKK